MPGIREKLVLKKEYDYIIVGAGLCGLVLAKELSQKNKKVLILERGGFVSRLGTAFYTPFFYDKMALLKSRQGVNIHRFFGVGGTSIVSCGNAVEFTREEYNRIGIDFSEQMDAAKKESHVKEGGLQIGRVSARIMDAANRLGYNMKPMPKFSMTDRCASCGNCVLGCGYDSKWTSRECLKDIDLKQNKLVTNFCVKKILHTNGKISGVEGLNGEKFLAEKVILAAGGIGSPVILQNSGIEAGKKFFVDLYNVTYGISKEVGQRKELVMATVCDKFHVSDGFVMAPFIDCFAAFIPTVDVKDVFNVFRISRMMGIMTKINNDSVGRVDSNGNIDKEPTINDSRKLKMGSDMSKEILIKCGVEPKSVFVGKVRGAHPGGTAAIGEVVNRNLETQVKGLFVCDASVLPFAPGLPPMLSLIALTKWFSESCLLKR